MAIGNAFSVAVKKARESHFTLFYEHLLRAHEVTVLFPLAVSIFAELSVITADVGLERLYWG